MSVHQGGLLCNTYHSISRGILSGNSIVGLEKVFVAKSADAHSKAKMYGCFEPIHSMKRMLGPENDDP